MKSAVETLSPTRAKLTVEVPFDELKPYLDKAYAAIAAQVQVPGFRKGKVPARIIDQRFGRGVVVQDAVNEALPELYAQAAQEQDLKVIGRPEVDVTAVPVADGEDFVFTVETDVRPQITLPDLDGIAVGVDDVEVTDEDITARLDDLRERFGTQVPVDRSAVDGDLVTIDLSARIGDTPIDSVEGLNYEIGSETMLPGLDEALVGLSAGETGTFVAPLAGGDHAGEPAECTVTVQAVKVRELPELDDEFAQLASSFDTLEELREDLRSQAVTSKRFEQGVQARDKVLEHLLATTDIPVPEGIVDDEVREHLEGEDRLDDDEHRAEVAENTRKALQAQFLLDALAEHLEVQVEQPELIEYLLMSAQQYGMDPNAFAQALDSQGQIGAMVGEVARRKALAAVLEKATVTDASGTVLDLDDLVPGRRQMAEVAGDEADDAEATEARATDAESDSESDAESADAESADAESTDSDDDKD